MPRWWSKEGRIAGARVSSSLDSERAVGLGVIHVSTAAVFVSLASNKSTTSNASGRSSSSSSELHVSAAVFSPLPYIMCMKRSISLPCSCGRFYGSIWPRSSQNIRSHPSHRFHSQSTPQPSSPAPPGSTLNSTSTTTSGQSSNFSLHASSFRTISLASSSALSSRLQSTSLRLALALVPSHRMPPAPSAGQVLSFRTSLLPCSVRTYPACIRLLLATA